MRALVTGRAGFVGSHFWRRLAADGWGVQGCDIAGPLPIDCRTLFARDDLREHYDLVIHCAAVVGGRAKIEGAPMAVAANLEIDAAMWQWALRTKPGRVVYFSSSAAYPIDEQGVIPGPTAHLDCFRLHEELINLEWIDQPDQTYGLAKLVGEIQAAHVRANAVPVTVVRPFSGFGETQDDTYPFPAFIARAAAREDPFTIWGDGEQTRDFIHIDDIVNATMVMVNEGIDGPVNLCTGRPTTFNDLAALVCKEAGYEPAFEHRLDAPTGVRYRVGDPTLMREFWTPRVTLEEGVRRALRARMAA